MLLLSVSSNIYDFARSKMICAMSCRAHALSIGYGSLASTSCSFWSIAGSILSWLEQMEFAGAGYSLGAVGRIEFGEDIFDVAFSRVEADNQAISDLLI